MVEMARELKKDRLVQISKVAKITGISENYLAQLAIPMKSEGLLVGVSGKKGGYFLSKKAQDIKLSEIIGAFIGSIKLTECVAHPEICLNSSFCSSRLIWVILSCGMAEILEKYTLADLVEDNRKKQLIDDYSHMELLFADKVMSKNGDDNDGCPDRGRPYAEET